jgi:hypothetical protein
VVAQGDDTPNQFWDLCCESTLITPAAKYTKSQDLGLKPLPMYMYMSPAAKLLLTLYTLVCSCLQEDRKKWFIYVHPSGAATTNTGLHGSARASLDDITGPIVALKLIADMEYIVD